MAKNKGIHEVVLVVMVCDGTPVFQKVNYHGDGVSLSTLEQLKESFNERYAAGHCVVDLRVMKTEKQADAYMKNFMKEWEEI